MKTLEPRSRAAWRAWLEKHHASVSEVWLIFRKGAAANPRLTYEDAVCEALCFGWIDSIIKYVDEERYLRKFTPRKADSRWSTLNRRRYEELKRAGLLAAPGIARPPNGKSGDAPQPSAAGVRWIEQALKKCEPAWTHFQALPPSQRRLYLVWIDFARQEATRERRLAEAIERLSVGKRLGMK